MSRQPLHEFQRAHDQVRGPVAPRYGKDQHQLGLDGANSIGWRGAAIEEPASEQFGHARGQQVDDATAVAEAKGCSCYCRVTSTET